MFFRKSVSLLALTLAAFAANAQYTTRDVTHYQYNAFSTADEASIDLYDGRKKVGIAVFLPLPANQLPNPSLSSSDNLIRLYYPIERLRDIVDLVRNESPIVMRYWSGAGNNSHIGVRWTEPVGEAE